MKTPSVLLILISLATVSVAQTPMPAKAPAAKLTSSAAFEFNDLKPETVGGGQRRAVFDNPTEYLSRFECHITTLPVGQNSGASHKHPGVDEAIVVQAGTVEVSLNDVKRTVGPGSVIYFAPNDLVGLRNAGTTIATYAVFSIRVAPAAKP